MPKQMNTPEPDNSSPTLESSSSQDLRGNPTDSPNSSDLILRRRKKRRIFAALAVAVIGFGAFMVWQTMGDNDDTSQADTLFTIDNQNYTESDINEQLEFLTSFGSTRETAIETIRRSLVYKIASEKFSPLAVSQEDVRQQLEEDGVFTAEDMETNAWARLNGTQLAVREKLNILRTSNYKKGYVYTFYFGSLVDTFTIDGQAPGSEDNVIPDGLGDEELITRDQEYARAQVEELRQALVDGSMSPEEVYDQVMSDPQLHLYYILPNEEGSWTQRFGYDDAVSWRHEVTLEPLIEFIDDYQQTDQASEIQTGRVPYMEREGEYDAYYYFVYLEESQDTVSEVEAFLRANGIEVDDDA